jgi:two-component system response regulator PilR (NtrC family)
VIELKVPSLRQRREDIPRLAGHVLEKLAEAQHVTLPVIKAPAMEALQRYVFPGNVRELENILERALTMCDGESIEPEDLALPEAVAETAEAPGPDQPPAPPAGVQLEEYLEDIERKAILKALEETHYNKTAAAKLLGITFRAMRYRLKKLGLE